MVDGGRDCAASAELWLMGVGTVQRRWNYG